MQVYPILAIFVAVTILSPQLAKSQESGQLSKLVLDFLTFFNGKSVILHADVQNGKSTLLNAHREVNAAGYYGYIADTKKDCKMFFENVDVHFVIFTANSVLHTLACLEHRQRFNKETWVLVSQSKDIMEIVNALQEGVLDYDDNIIVTLDDGNTLMLKEIYKINAEFPVQYRDVGTWSMEGGLQYTSVPKWYRRGDMMVTIQNKQDNVNY